MITRIDLGWSDRKEIKALDREAWNKLAANVPQLDMAIWEADKDQPAIHIYGDKYLDSSQLVYLHQVGVEYTVKQMKNMYAVATAPATELGQSVTNINIALPNIGLLMVDEVTWRDDECTERIQSMLDEGWRILAICPPNGARRPDYILGRTKK